MISAIRIEHDDGLGIFVGRGGRYRKTLWDTSMDAVTRHDNFPSPFEEMVGGDFKAFRYGKHFCAYRNLPQLLTWLTKKEIRSLISVGHRIYLLELSKALIGFQIAYEKKDIIRQTDITEELCDYIH